MFVVDAVAALMLAVGADKAYVAVAVSRMSVASMVTSSFALMSTSFPAPVALTTTDPVAPFALSVSALFVAVIVTPVLPVPVKLPALAVIAALPVVAVRLTPVLPVPLRLPAAAFKVRLFAVAVIVAPVAPVAANVEPAARSIVAVASASMSAAFRSSVVPAVAVIVDADCNDIVPAVADPMAVVPAPAELMDTAPVAPLITNDVVASVLNVSVPAGPVRTKRGLTIGLLPFTRWPRR